MVTIPAWILWGLIIPIGLVLLVGTSLAVYLVVSLLRWKK